LMFNRYNVSFLSTTENAAGIKYPTLNLKGYLVGNGATDEEFDNTQVPFAHGKGLISDELY